VELLDALDHRIDLVLRRQESDTEVISAFTLTKARAGDNTDTSCFEESKRIEGISRDVSSLSSFDSLRRQSDAGEEVHGTRRLGASEALKGVDSTTQLDSTTLERLDDIILLLLVELIRGLSGLGRIDHAVHDELTHGVGAEGDGLHLIEHGLDVREEVIELNVATTVTTLAEEALGDGVEAGNLDALPDILTHLISNLTEAGELGTILVEVLLVHLISKEDDATLDAEADNVLHALDAENLTSGVVRVDHDETTADDAVGSGLLVAAIEVSGNQRPAIILVEGIADLVAVVEGGKGGVERGRGSRSHDAGLLVLTDEKVEHVANTSRGTIGAVDGVRVAWEAIASSDELGDVLANERVAFAEGVGASEEASLKQTLGTGDGIRSKSLRSLLHQLRVLHEGADLPDEGDGLLLELLGVANVAIGDIVKRQTGRNTLLLGVEKLLLQLCCTNCHSTTNLVLGNKNTRIDGIITGNMNVITHCIDINRNN